MTSHLRATFQIQVFIFLSKFFHNTIVNSSRHVVKRPAHLCFSVAAALTCLCGKPYLFFRLVLK